MVKPKISAENFTLTSDSFEGQERDIIAITLTRSNPQGKNGFPSDIRRMNVGMNRAWRKLLLKLCALAQI